MPVLSLDDRELLMWIQQECLSQARSNCSDCEGERHLPLHCQGPSSSLPGGATFELKIGNLRHQPLHDGGGPLLVANQIVYSRTRRDKSSSGAYA